MKYSIILTSLFKGNGNEGMTYFVNDDSGRRMYCDALFSAEAFSKYFLANHHIDEILVLGESRTYDERDDQVPMALKGGREFYDCNIEQLSTYGLLRYRLAQFLDELHSDDQSVDDLLDEDERLATTALLEDFFKQHREDNWKFNRFFDALSRNDALQDDLWQAMDEGLPRYHEHPKAYQEWIKRYLYEQLKDSSKLELLEGNEEVMVHFLATDGQRGANLVKKLKAELPTLGSADNEPMDIDLYLCLHNEDAIDTFSILSVIEHVTMMPGSRVNVIQVATIPTQDHFANPISDATEFYDSATLLTATRVFLRFGKTDLLSEYWIHLGVDNPFISRIINDMRIIDVGISLCDIADIERGIRNLRNELNNNSGQLGDSPIENLFSIVVESVKRDFGSLLDYNSNHFIELVKWTYRKGFLQQALTLVESRAPEDFVDRGIYYYCDSQETADNAIRILGQVYYYLKPNEKYKLDDISHYFVKYYGRNRCARGKNSYERQRNYAQQRIDDLDTQDEKVLRAHTCCTDREALNNLLFAYYRMGDVRNTTNHAIDEEEDVMMRAESDVSIRLETINQALRSFIKSYECVAEHLGELPAPIRKVTTQDLYAYSRTLRPTHPQDNRDHSRSNRNDGGADTNQAGNDRRGGNRRHRNND